MKYRVVPELYCRSLADNLSFFIDVLGFSLKYERQEEGFAYLTREGVDLMLEELNDEHRQWIDGALSPPFGRGVNFQWDVSDIEGLYQTVKQQDPRSIYLALEVKAYQCGEILIQQQQFIVRSPDGYYFGFATWFKGYGVANANNVGRKSIEEVAPRMTYVAICS